MRFNLEDFSPLVQKV